MGLESFSRAPFVYPRGSRAFLLFFCEARDTPRVRWLVGKRILFSDGEDEGGGLTFVAWMVQRLIIHFFRGMNGALFLLAVCRLLCIN